MSLRPFFGDPHVVRHRSYSIMEWAYTRYYCHGAHPACIAGAFSGGICDLFSSDPLRVPVFYRLMAAAPAGGRQPRPWGVMTDAERDTRRRIVYGRHVAACQCRFGARAPCGSGFRLDDDYTARSIGPRSPSAAIGRRAVPGRIGARTRNRRQRLAGSIRAQRRTCPRCPRGRATLISPRKPCLTHDATALPGAALSART
jgi:hypothetical protein